MPLGYWVGYGGEVTCVEWWVIFLRLAIRLVLFCLRYLFARRYVVCYAFAFPSFALVSCCLLSSLSYALHRFLSTAYLFSLSSVFTIVYSANTPLLALQ